MADKKKNILTYEGLKALEEELHDLKVVRRREVAAKIKEAREQGDLSENAEYDAAKEEQGHIEARIDEDGRLLLESCGNGEISFYTVGASNRYFASAHSEPVLVPSAEWNVESKEIIYEIVDNVLKIRAMEHVEYQLSQIVSDAGEEAVTYGWTTEPEFTLEPGPLYIVYARLQATEECIASKTVQFMVSTDFEPYFLGNVNKDYKIDVADAVLILQGCANRLTGGAIFGR